MGFIARLLPAPGPQRRMTVATFANSFGGGMFVTSSVLYFTKVLKYSAGQVAFGLFLGAMIGLAAGVLVGQLADRFGAREAHVAVMTCGAVGMACFLLVRSYWQYVLICVVIGLVYAADKSSKAPLIRHFGGDDPTAFRVYLRAVINVALSLGAVTAGFGIQLNSPIAYRCLIAARVAAFLTCALIEIRLPRLKPMPTPSGKGRWAAFRDRPYLTATTLNCLMSLHLAVPSFLLPLWVVDETLAPRWTVSALLVLNMVLVALLQVAVSKGVEDEQSAGRRMRWAGMALLVGLTMMGIAHGRGIVAATVLLVGGIAVYTFGELWHAAASMEWSFGLAPPHAQGQFAGVFGLGGGVAEAAAPAVLSTLGLGLGQVGWMLLGVGFLAVGAVSPPLVAWAARSSQDRVAPIPVTIR